MDENERSGWMKFVRDNIAVAFQQHFIPVFDDKTGLDLWDFISKKLQNPSIRSYFVFAVSQYIDAETKKEPEFPPSLFDTDLPLVADLMMTVMYMDNFILDGKGGVLVEKQLNMANINRILIGRNLLKSQIEEYLDARPGLSVKQKKMVGDILREIYIMVDLAQYWDKNSSGYEQYADPDFRWKQCTAKSEHFLQDMLFDPAATEESLMDWLWKELKIYGIKEEKRQFIEHYFRRIALENAALFVLWAELIMQLKGYAGKEYQRMKQFAFLYGLMTQVVNDNVDPLPAKFEPQTAVKQPEDFCADVRNGLVTLPLLIYFAEKPDRTMADLQNLLQRSDEALFNEIRQTVADQARPFGQTMTKRLPEYLNSSNGWYRNLRDIMSYAFSRKLYKHFDEIKNVVK